ncbi:MAG: exodeoxyribonuclease VII large subunit, partial [Clostridia bacterium]|nr:exodeoxyribonuclease VII large subunit [Clostridia bacterium]
VKGHAYFILKDENCQISANCFNCAKTYVPKVGESIIAKGSVDYYAKGGKLNFNVDSITPIGKGMLALQFEMLKRKLQGEGYFDEQFKKPIPQYPTNVCVITSFSGAVIRDIKKTVRRKNDLINIFIKDVRVQGSEAHNDIIKALEQVDKLGYDVLIIARGGGSAEDLMPFNNEALVKAIFKCKTPIISAVGHETDVTLCDLTADYRAATPTAAAEYIAYDTALLKDYFADVLLKMNKYAKRRIADGEKELKSKFSYINSAMKLEYSLNARVIEQYLIRLVNAADKASAVTEHRLANAIAKLQILNPLAVLEKGYWYMSKEGKPVVTTKSLAVGETVSLRTRDGKVKAQILEVKDEI